MTGSLGPRGWDDIRSDLAAVARRLGTPAYVVDVESLLERAAAELESAFPRPWLRQRSLEVNDLPGVVAAVAPSRRRRSCRPTAPSSSVAAATW